MRPLEELKFSSVRPAPSERDFDEFEVRFGVHLPIIYRAFLKCANGGYPAVDTFESNDGEQWAVNNFFLIGPETDSTEALAWNYINRRPETLVAFLPIARDGFGNIFLLSLDSEQTGEVWIWIRDQAEGGLQKLSDRFEEFIDRLDLNPAYI